MAKSGQFQARPRQPVQVSRTGISLLIIQQVARALLSCYRNVKAYGRCVVQFLCDIQQKKPLHTSLSLVPDWRLFGLLVLECFCGRLVVGFFWLLFITLLVYLAAAEHTKVMI